MTSESHKLSLTGFKYEELIFGKRNLQEKNTHKPALLN